MLTVLIFTSCGGEVSQGGGRRAEGDKALTCSRRGPGLSQGQRLAQQVAVTVLLTLKLRLQLLLFWANNVNCSMLISNL